MSRLSRAGSIVAGLAASMAAAGPAAAQYYYGPGYGAPYSYNVPPPAGGYYGGPYGGRPYGGDEQYPAVRTLSARQVIDRLEDQGYEDIGRPRFTGATYVLDATGPGDIRMRVVVDAVRGVVLNRTALGEPRQFRLRDDDDDDDRGPQRRYSRQDPVIPQGNLLENPLGPRREPEQPRNRREAARPPESSNPGRALPAPADPRLQPGAAAPSPVEGRPPEREAARSPSPTRTKPETNARPYGLNPETGAPKAKPVEQARRPANNLPPANPQDMARLPVPSQGGATRPQPRRGETADAAKPGEPKGKPVRVIGGVTPMNNASPKPAGEGPARYPAGAASRAGSDRSGVDAKRTADLT